MNSPVLKILLLSMALVLCSCSDSDGTSDVNDNGGSGVVLERDSVAEMVRFKSAGKTVILGTDFSEAKPIERPQMKIMFSYDFAIDRHEVTCFNFNKLMKTVSGLQVSCPNDSIPASNVTFFDAVLYSNALSKKANRDTAYTYVSSAFDADRHCVKLDGFSFVPESDGFRLPTEAEWSLAASVEWNPEKSWNGDNSDGMAHKICSASKDGMLCDFAGNMLEWVNDWQGPFRDTTIENYVGAVDGGVLGSCVVKGGSFFSAPNTMNIYNRGDTYPVLYSSRGDYVGFRLAYGVIPHAVWLSSQGNVMTTPVVALVNRSEIRSLTSSEKAKLVFRNDETGNLMYVSYASEKPLVVEIRDTIDSYHPEISPDGSRVAFCTTMEGQSAKSSVYVRDLNSSGDHLVKLDVENAAIPRWRVDSQGDTLIVYVTSAAGNKGDQFLKESTWQVSFKNGKFGTPQKLFDGAYHGGVSHDGKFAVTGSPLLRGRMTLDGSIVDSVWYGGDQACNASLAKDSSKRTLFLDFGGKAGISFSGKKYSTHQQILIADRTGSLVQMVPTIKGYSFDHSEWVSGEQSKNFNHLVVVSLTDPNGVHSKIALVDLLDSSVTPLVDGGELWHPSLWIKQSASSQSPNVDLDSAGVYFVQNENNPVIYSSVELGIKLQSFWKMKDELEFVSFGSSMLMDAVIDDSIKTYKALNMGVTLCDAYVFHHLLKNYVLPYAPKIKAVAVELTPGLMYRYEEEMFNPLMNFSPGLQYDKNHLSKETVEAIAANSLDQEYPTDLWAQQYMEGTFLLPSVSWSSPSVSNDTTVMNFESKNFQQVLGTFKSMKRIADSCGVLLVAAITPSNPLYKKTGAYGFFGPSHTVAHQLIDAVEDMGYIIFDENKDGDHDYTDEMAFNTNHLSYLGARQFTARLDSLLKKLKD